TSVMEVGHAAQVAGTLRRTICRHGGGANVEAGVLDANAEVRGVAAAVAGDHGRTQLELAVLREVDAVARIADDLGAPHDEALALVAADARAGVVENLRVVDPQPRTVEAFERCVAGAGDAH